MSGYPLRTGTQTVGTKIEINVVDQNTKRFGAAIRRVAICPIIKLKGRR
jgi:hypothetical protein